MTDVTTDEAAAGGPGPAPERGPARPAPPHLGWAVAGLSAAAGAIHLAMVPAHAGNGLTDPIGFAVVGWFQLLVAGAILADRAGRNLYRAAVVGNLAVIGLWIWSRTAGLPVGGHADVAEEVDTIDTVASLLAVGIVLLAARVLLSRQRVAVGRLAPALAAVAALGLASVVIVSPEAADHGGGGHAHGEGAAAHGDLMAQIDAERCDASFNPSSYWDEARYLGVDTYQGGAMSTVEHGHDDAAGGTVTATTDPDPTGGRGSATLDELVSLTGAAGQGEAAAAMLVAKLGGVEQEDYDAWLWWLRSSGTVGGGHAHDSAAPGDAGGHGGHVGPQPWVAMTDQAACDRLAEEIELARETALRYPTAADATAAGWYKVTGYVPGIAAHYMNFGVVDGTFEIDKPEMILYDGNGPDARVVGLSYYIVHDGEAQPTQGFTGANDHYHRHIGLCIGAGGVIGDTTTTDEECEAIGGTKSGGNNGWMSHAWVVPGCESPWGLFSAATPVLDVALSLESGQNDGACSASGVRDRYDLDSPTAVAPESVEVAAGG